jgi:hypothetical protein
MPVILHPLYSPALASCDFFLFPKMKLKLKGSRFDTIEEIQAESPRVLDTGRKGLPESFPNGGSGGTGVYLWEGATSKVMAVNRPYGEFYNFYSVSPEYLGYTLVLTDVSVKYIGSIFKGQIVQD